MSATAEIVEIPTFQTAEQLMDYLLEEFMFMASMGGMIILTNDDLRTGRYFTEVHEQPCQK